MNEDRKTWTLLAGEDFHCEAFQAADGTVTHVTIIPRLRDAQIAHYASEGLTNVEAQFQAYARFVGLSPYSEDAVHGFQGVVAS